MVGVGSVEAKRALIQWAMRIFIACVSAYLAYYFVTVKTPKQVMQASQRGEIKNCWIAESKTLSDGPNQITAASCQKMEAEFTARWGARP